MIIRDASNGAFTAKNGSPLLTNLYPGPLAFVSGHELLGSGLLLGSDGGPDTGQDAGVVFKYSADGGLAWIWPSMGRPGAGTVGAISVGPSTEVYFGASSPPRLVKLSNGATTTAMFNTIGTVSGSPALGLQVDGGEILYAPTDAGVVYAIDAKTLSEVWRMPPLTGGSSFFTSATLDCARLPDAGTFDHPGTLYVFGEAPLRLYSLITDSHGLHTEAPWPKYQHDARNSGAAAPNDPLCP